MLIFLAMFLLLFSLPQRIFAVYDPLSVPNNKYGMHTVESMDIPDIAPLVNSSGGDWGYVTLVIGENDRNPDKWQRVFDQMRKSHLIPIVRLATHIEGSSWSKPKPDSFREWVDFLSKLTWVVKNRYVVLFNEPNHANEWGGTINPEEYAQTLTTLAKQLKETSGEFFILPAGLDASADGNSHTMDEETFLRRMFAASPDIAPLLDGWTSHSYPNPGFSGSPYASGRGSMRTFQWELEFIQQLGIKKSLPVFITETGWIHSEGVLKNAGLLSPAQVGANLQIAASSVWTDPRIVAITPFVFNYQGLPFDHFSWRKLASTDYYAQYGAYQAIAKQQGRPKKLERYELTKPLLPPTAITGSTYTFASTITNTGEAILAPADGYKLIIDDESKAFAITSEPLPTIEPGQTGTITITVKTPATPGKFTVEIKLSHDGDTIPITRQEVILVPPPSIVISAQLGWRKRSNADNVTVLLYQQDHTLVHKFTGRTLKNGKVTIEKLLGIVPNEPYRIVMLVPYYLPRQKVAPLSDRETNITLMRFLPLDTDGDGAWTVSDFFVLVKTQPNKILPLFFSP